VGITSTLCDIVLLVVAVVILVGLLAVVALVVAIATVVRRDKKLDLPFGAEMGEAEILGLLKTTMAKNVIAKSFIGMGYHGTKVPNVVLRNLLENPGWYTAYTPYQAEIAQGRLESLVNFQTLVCELTGMEVANASLLDEATAAAEAMSMVARAMNSKTNQFFVCEQVHPQTLEVVQVRAEYFGFDVIVGDHAATDFSAMPRLFGALVQYPDTTGVLRDYSGMSAQLHKNKAYLIVAADPLNLVLSKPPIEFGADVVVGTMQKFGVPQWFGGPHAAYMATSVKQVRRMLGRIIGETLDRLGNPAYRLTLQTREQHIRLDKATSNVCTAQVLLANMAAMYAVWHRSDGLKAVARHVHGVAKMFASDLAKMGVPVASDQSFFDTVAFSVTSACVKDIIAKSHAKSINIRALDSTRLSASFDETHSRSDVHELLAALRDSGLKGGPAPSPTIAINGEMPAEFAHEALSAATNL